MTPPNITEWLQAGVAIAAFMMSAASLYWQWRTKRQQEDRRITAVARRRYGEAWTCEVSYQAVDRAAALCARIEVLDWNGTTLFFANPDHALDMDPETYKPFWRTDWSNLRSDPDLHAKSVHSDLEFEGDTSLVAKGEFGVFPNADYCRIRVTVSELHSGAKLHARIMTLSPTLSDVSD